MRGIVVSGDVQGGKLLTEFCNQRERTGLYEFLNTAQEALDYAAQNHFRMAVLDDNLPDMSILQLCRELKEKNPQFIPVFITNGPELAMEAYQLGAADYLTRPFSDERLEKAMDRTECLAKYTTGLIQVRTFGHFDVFVDGLPVKFTRQKSKEILAYLVDRWGGYATTQQILADLWEDHAGEKSAMSGFQTAFKTLRMDMEKAGIGQILISDRNQKSIDANALDCDYYKLLEGDPGMLETFTGQYMAEYSWAEMTNANCIRMKQIYEEKQLDC